MVLILKTELGGDLRRIPVGVNFLNFFTDQKIKFVMLRNSKILTLILLHNDFLTFDELHLMLCRVYSVDIDDDDKVKYKDLEGDWITIADSNDLQLAIQVYIVS